jgi:hypothetical protein
VIPPDDEVSQGFRREDITEATDPRGEEPSVEVDLGGGRSARITLPQLPQWLWAAISLLLGGSGTAVGSLASQDWLGWHAREELAEVRCELRLAQCGCHPADQIEVSP